MLAGTPTTASEQPKTEKDANWPEKPQEGHQRTPKNKPDRIPPSALLIFSAIFANRIPSLLCSRYIFMYSEDGRRLALIKNSPIGIA